jgi:hypothetical protein
LDVSQLRGAVTGAEETKANADSDVMDREQTLRQPMQTVSYLEGALQVNPPSPPTKSMDKICGKSTFYISSNKKEFVDEGTKIFISRFCYS